MSTVPQAATAAPQQEPQQPPASASPAQAQQQVPAKPRPEPGTEEAAFALLQRKADMYSKSTLIPDDYKGQIANCAIALDLAERLRANPLMIMQNLYIVYGRPGWSAQFLIATFNQCGRFAPIQYEFFGQKGTDGYGCRAVSEDLKSGKVVRSADVTVGIAKAEGWYDRKSKSGNVASKWPTMTDLMLQYRSGSWLVKTHAPELSMGLPTVEEIEDIGPVSYSEAELMERMAIVQSLAQIKLQQPMRHDEVLEFLGYSRTFAPDKMPLAALRSARDYLAKGGGDQKRMGPAPAASGPPTPAATSSNGDAPLFGAGADRG